LRLVKNVEWFDNASLFYEVATSTVRFHHLESSVEW
jgi:hypothetical protein